MRRTAIAVCALLALGACKVDVTVNIQVAADGSGTVTLTAIADAEVVAQAPGLAEDLRFDDAVAAGWTLDGPTATEDGGLRVVLTHTFATVAEASALLQSINGTSGPLQAVTITRSDADSQITTFLTGSLRVDGQLQAFADADILSAIGSSPYEQTIRNLGLAPSDAVSFTLIADLPGDSAAADTPMEWIAPLDGTTLEVAATAALAQGGSSGIWGTVSTLALVALIGWCLVAIAFIVFVARARKRRALAASSYRPRPLNRR